MTRWLNGGAVPGSKLRRIKSDEDFMLAFGDVQVHGPDDDVANTGNANNNVSGTGTGPGAHDDVDLNDLVDFSAYWDDSLTTKDPRSKSGASDESMHYTSYSSPQHQQLHDAEQRFGNSAAQSAASQQPAMASEPFPPVAFSVIPQNSRLSLMSSSSTSPTEGGGTADAATLASETSSGGNRRFNGNESSTNLSGAGTGSDVISTLSNDTDDTSSRSKRRRTTSCTFQPLEQVRENTAAQEEGQTGDGNFSNQEGEDDGDVRPWKVEIPDHDVVLGDTHEPTWGTRIYRDVRKPYAKKTITNEQLKNLKLEFQRRMEKEMGKKIPCQPRFWCNKENKTKTKQIPVSGHLKNRPGILYAYAQDQAIKDDIKNASARPRTRNAKRFNFKGSLNQVVEKALATCDQWVGEDIDKELYAKGFKEDLARLMPWRQDYIKRKETSEQKAAREPVMRGTHMREARIHEAHAGHLELIMVDMVNQLGNMMLDTYKTESKKAKSMASVSTGGDSGSFEESSAGVSSRNRMPPPSVTTTTASSSAASPSFVQSSTELPSGASNNSRFKKDNQQGRNEIGMSTKKTVNASEKATSITRKGPEDIEGMEISPINVRKALLSESLANGKLSPDPMRVGDQAKLSAGPRQQRKDLSSMFSQNLRMASLDDNMMPPGLPREVRPGAPDELSVLSAPDDLSFLFMESRESAIRRGIDEKALPRPGHVADRTKALLQQMKAKSNGSS